MTETQTDTGATGNALVGAITNAIFGRAGLLARMGVYPFLGWLAAQTDALTWDPELFTLSVHFSEGGAELVGIVAAYTGTVIWSRAAKAKGGAT